MFKIFQINVTSNWGSTGRIASEIGDALIYSGSKSYIACGRHIRNSSSEIIRVGSSWSIYKHILYTRLFDRHGLASINATKKLVRQIQLIKPDIIHLHNIHGYYLNYKILFNFLSASHLPVVWTLHDCWAFTGHCSYYAFANCQRWKTGCYDCPQKRNYPAAYGMDRSLQNYYDKKFWFTKPRNVTLVPVSNWLAEEVRKSFLGKYPIHKIYNGINTDIFHPYDNREEIFNRYEISGNFLLLGVANVWDQRKGLNDFLQLYEKLPKDFTLLLVGLSKKQIHSLPRGILGIERTESIELLAQLYSAADVFVNLSVEETFGLTTAESLACGTPAVVYCSTACPELVPPEVGFVVEVGNINDIMQKISFVKDAGKSFYSQSCRKWVLDNFKKEECYNAYIQLYRELLYPLK